MKDGATYTTVDVPGATGTAVSGINNAGEIVGTYTDGTGFHGFRATPIVVPVQIEVEPFVPKDPIFLNSPIPLPVAVFGSSNVDVTQIDLSSLRFGPKFATPLSTQIVTVNGQTDLVAIFRVQDTGLAVGDTQACLQGEIAGQLFRGCDGVVVIERGCGLGFELAPILSVLLWLRGRRTRKLP
ncbi:MAG TPA: hypothetical protein DEP35_10350 [Deltaproteobacteria bacterium]|nr:hypothetical protein [Deltaproteobacteria bacterium]